MVLPFPWSSSRALTTWDSIGIIGRELPESTLAGLGGDLVAVVPLNASGRSSSTEDIRSCSFSRLNCVCHQESTTLEYHSAKQNSTHGPLWVERQTRHRRCSLLFEKVPRPRSRFQGQSRVGPGSPRHSPCESRLLTVGFEPTRQGGATPCSPLHQSAAAVWVAGKEWLVK
jgi:hypothetical protein